MIDNPKTQSEEKYRQLFDNMAEGVAIFEAVDDGQDFVFVDYNQAGQSMDRVTKNDAIGKKVTEVFPGVRDFGLFDVFRRVWQTGKPEQHPTSLYQHGKLSFYRANYVYQLPGGQIVSVYTDETQRQQAEEEIRRSKILLESSIESPRDMIILSLDREYRYLYFNKGHAQSMGHVFGTQPQIGDCIFDHMQGQEDIEKVKAHYDQALAGEGHVAIEEYGGNQTRYYYEIRYNPIYDQNNEIIGVTAFANNITDRIRLAHEREQLEEQYRQSQKMEAIGQLAGGMAHDFNNLLTVINSYARFLTEDLRDGDPLKADSQQILNAGQRAAALTRQLLAFSRKQIMETTILDLNQVIANLEKMLKRLISEDIEFSIVLARELDQVSADPGQIEQVLMNLVVNARDAMPRGGRLSIETANVELKEDDAGKHPDTRAGPYVMLAVTDNGAGMSAETKERIFEPFFTTKDKGQGTGLGLATVYGIVKQTGGHIRADSEPGRGTTLRVFLPRDEAAKIVPPLAADTTDLRGTETILVVEDEEAVRKLACRILTSAGYPVVDAANGGEALLACEQHQGKIHLLLTDVVMPKMSGKELANRLAVIRPRLKVLYMSGYTDDSIGRHGFLDEGTHFIGKPFNPPDLLKKIRLVLNDD